MTCDTGQMDHFKLWQCPRIVAMSANIHTHAHMDTRIHTHARANTQQTAYTLQHIWLRKIGWDDLKLTLE